MSRALSIALALALGLLASLALGACGADTETTTVTETTIPDEIPATVPGDTNTGTTETEKTGTEKTETTDASTVASSQGPKLFSTPSGNIGCTVSTTYVRCDIGEHTWTPNPPSEPCDFDYGNGLFLDREHADFTCASDTTLGIGEVLPYGSSSQRGTFRCDSEESGVTCSDVQDGHGFFISKQSFRIF